MNINEAVEKYKVISIIRAIEEDRIIPVAEALYKGGIRLIEVTFDQGDPQSMERTPKSIKKLREFFSENVYIGAGTVMDGAQVRAAHEAGAEYIISPNTDKDVITLTKKMGMISMPGAFTPGEIAKAHKYGADYVKVFPAGLLGPAYIKAVKAPLSHIKFLAVGGVNEDNMEEFYKAGAIGFGIGANIVDAKTVKDGRYEDITARASKFAYKSLSLGTK